METFPNNSIGDQWHVEIRLGADHAFKNTRQCMRSHMTPNHHTEVQYREGTERRTTHNIN